MINKRYKRFRVYFIMIILLVIGIGVGYAYIYSDLSVDTSVLLKKYESDVLYDIMMLNSSIDNTSSTYVSSATGIDFSSNASETNGQGVYMDSETVDNQYPIYYFRGDVSNNNVKFANFCWKIVRTTDTGGVKILYNGVPADDGSCDNSGSASNIGTAKFNDVSTLSMADVGYKYGTRYEMTSATMSTKRYRYGNNVTYDSSTGLYTLNDTYYNSSVISGTWANTFETIKSKYHYTCMSTDSSCSTVYYIYYVGLANAHYIPLTGGMLLSSTIDEMTIKSTNDNKSTAMSMVEDWYAANMTSYTDKLEDTYWCNDRSVSALNSWDENGDTIEPITFMANYRFTTLKRPTSSCSNPNDKFTVSSGWLNYPVGLLTVDDVMYGSTGLNTYLYSGSVTWTMSPSTYNYDGAHVYYYNSLIASTNAVSDTNAIRPVVSLKQGTRFSDGDGSVLTPYVVE